MAAPRRRRQLAPRVVTPGDVARAYQEFGGSEAGQIVLADLVRRFGYTRSSTLVEGKPDVTARNEGQRTVLQWIGYMQDVDPAEYERTHNPQGER